MVAETFEDEKMKLEHYVSSSSTEDCTCSKCRQFSSVQPVLKMYNDLTDTRVARGFTSRILNS